ncbi:sensor domain-containing protein, partial [Mycobacterium kansasii]
MPDAALSGLLLDPPTVNAIMGTRDLAVNPKLTTTKLYIDTTDKPECGGVWANANKTVYSGSAWQSVQTQYLVEPESPWFSRRLGLLDFDQGLIGPFRSV